MRISSLIKRVEDKVIHAAELAKPRVAVVAAQTKRVVSKQAEAAKAGFAVYRATSSSKE